MAFFCNSIGRLWRNRIISVQHPHHDVTSSTSLERCLLRSVWSEAPSTETLPGERFYDSTVEKVTHKQAIVNDTSPLLRMGALRIGVCCSMLSRRSRRSLCSKCWNLAELRFLMSPRSLLARDTRRERYAVWLGLSFYVDLPSSSMDIAMVQGACENNFAFRHQRTP